MTTFTQKRGVIALVVVGVAAVIGQWMMRGHGGAPARPQPDRPATMPSAHDEHAGHVVAPTRNAVPAGYAPVTIDPEKRRALKIATAAAEVRDLSRTLRTVGVVTLDETRSAHVHPRVRGWIDAIHADFVGKRVKKGEPLAMVYSQEVYAAQIELLSMLERGPSPMLDAARRRLALWDVPESEIARLESTREPRRAFPLLAPLGGTVVAKQAVHGMYVDPSIELYTLSDLSRVWVLADVYEGDVASVKLGANARLTMADRRDPIEAKVAFLAPLLDEATRTRKVRFDVAGADVLPGAFASVEIELDLGRGLAVPEAAVIRTGARAIVFIAHGDHMMPREIELGPRIGDVYRVESGLEDGDQVAVGAQFLLDSESRLRATGGGGGHVH